MVKIIWTEKAIADLEDIGEYIAKDSIKYSQNTIKSLFRSTGLIKMNPRLGRIVPELKSQNIREIIKGNYRIIYLIKDENRIEILTVHHSARDLKEL